MNHPKSLWLSIISIHYCLHIYRPTGQFWKYQIGLADFGHPIYWQSAGRLAGRTARAAQPHSHTSGSLLAVSWHNRGDWPVCLIIRQARLGLLPWQQVRGLTLQVEMSRTITNLFRAGTLISFALYWPKQVTGRSCRFKG